MRGHVRLPCSATHNLTFHCQNRTLAFDFCQGPWISCKYRRSLHQHWVTYMPRRNGFSRHQVTYQYLTCLHIILLPMTCLPTTSSMARSLRICFMSTAYHSMLLLPVVTGHFTTKITYGFIRPRSCIIMQETWKEVCSKLGRDVRRLFELRKPSLEIISKHEQAHSYWLSLIYLTSQVDPQSTFWIVCKTRHVEIDSMQNILIF